MIFKQITSRDNPSFRQLKALRQPRKARAAGLIFIEGFRQVEQVLTAGLTVAGFLVTAAARSHPRWPAIAAIWQDQSTAEGNEACECLEVSDRLFAELSATDSPQGIALLVRSPLAVPPVAPPQPDGFYLIAEAVQDPGNLGTLIRIADAFALTGVLILDGTTDPFGEKALRAAMGSTFHVHLLAFPDIRAAQTWLNQAAVPILAADLAGEDLWALPRPLVPPAALVIGNEGNGLSPQALQCADRRLKIPMPGCAESLNAAAAAAILCHELARGRAAAQARKLT